ncbi:MAG TPA: hypothetical protein VKV25_10230, partial [Acidimicrobiales bacterium]|nr:hypothetical protein [Acidimicrobiales bacterium]
AGRGYANVVARSADGQRFETVAEVASAQFASASLERPALAVADGTWRLFVSCSSHGSKHWWVEVLEAGRPEGLADGHRHVVLPGDDTTAWKDPVVLVDDGGWRMWVCRHHIVPADQADRMDSWYATSEDGRHWDLHGPALEPRPGAWDGRGARVSAVLRRGAGWVALYDGRASAEENWEERTGVALGDRPGRLAALDGGPLVASPSLRYAATVELPDGSWLVYYEAARADGAHELRVENVPRSTDDSQSA